MLGLARFNRLLGRAFTLLPLAIAIPTLAIGDAINGTWQQLTPAGDVPPWRKYFAATYDPTRERLVADGKWPDLYDDTWALSLSGTPAWSLLWPASGGWARQWHSGIYDAPRDRMLVFGWMDGYPFGPHNEVLEFSFGGTPAKTYLTTAGTPPTGRHSHSMTYDPVRERMIVFGGTLQGSILSNEVWELSLSGTPTWTLLAPLGTPPSARNSHSAIYDPVRDAMVVFGGTTASGRSTEVWQLTLSGTPTWSLIATTGTPPDGRNRHSAIYDPLRDRMVVFGGFATGSVQMNDLWALPLSGTPAWSQLAPQGTLPAAREGHEAIYDAPRDRMVVYGGQFPPEDLWVLNWSPLVGVEPESPATGALTLQMRPNPVATEVALEFSLPREGRARVGIYDLRGAAVRRLVDGRVPAGLQRLRWDRTSDRGERVPSGVYFLSLRSDSGDLTRRLLVID